MSYEVGCTCCLCGNIFGHQINVHGTNWLIPSQKVPKLSTYDHSTCRVARCTSPFSIFHWQLIWLFIGPLWIPNNECLTCFGLFILIKCPTSHQQTIVDLMATHHVPTIHWIVPLSHHLVCKQPIMGENMV
jgi:hypothetical protein